MDTNIIKYPHSELEILRHYYPDSLIGQANGIVPKIQPEPDVHMDFTREDGSESCSCGLIYLDSPYQRYGHRNHLTGLPEPVFKYLSPDAYLRRKYDDIYNDESTETRINCERCAMSMTYSVYLSRGSSHDCWMEPYEQAHCSIENAKRVIIDQALHFKLDTEIGFMDEHVYVTLTPTLDGLKISPTDSSHKEAISRVLETKTIVFSDEAYKNYLEIEPSKAMQKVDAKNKDDLNKFRVDAEILSKYRVSFGGGEGWFRVIDAGAELPHGTRFSLSKHFFSRHCISSGIPVLRIPTIQTK